MATFDDQSNKRIISSVQWTERQAAPGVGRGRKRRPAGGRTVTGSVAKVTELITDFDEPTLVPGEGMVQPYQINDAGVLVTRGEPVKCYTIATQTAVDTWIQYKTDAEGNNWIDVELCE